MEGKSVLSTKHVICTDNIADGETKIMEEFLLTILDVLEKYTRGKLQYCRYTNYSTPLPFPKI
jgi:hypothetical protein